MNKLTITLLLVFSVIFATKGTAFAQTISPTPTGCELIYGGGQNCPAANIAIDKKVLNVSTNNYVDNLGTNDYMYKDGDSVTFQIKITNIGTTTLSAVPVKDIFPIYLSFVSGPGTFDSGSGILNFSVNNLAPNQTATFTIIGKVIGSSQLNQSSGSCEVNQVMATNQNGQSVQDSSQFCINMNSLNGVNDVTTTPTQENRNQLSVGQPLTKTTNTPNTGADQVALCCLVCLGLLGYQINNYCLKRYTKISDSF